MKRKEPNYKYNYVLLIDDNDLDNFINQKTIEVSYFSNKIYVNSGSKSALEFLKNLEISKQLNVFPEVIFVDLNMAMIDGIQFIENFKQLMPDKFKSVKVVVLTSSIMPSDKDKVTKLSKDILFLNKPLTKEILDQI